MVKKILKSTGLSLSESIESTADKIALALEKYVDADDTSAIAEIEVSKTTNHHRSGDIFRAEINFHHRLGTHRVEATREDLFMAMNAAKDELVEVVRSKKSKTIGLMRRGGLKWKNMLRGLPWRKGQ